MCPLNLNSQLSLRIASSAAVRTIKFLLLWCLLICFKPAAAQVNYDVISFKIDSLADAGLPKSALKEVSSLDELARKNNNPAWQVKAAIYRMTFQSYLEESALKAIISGLKTDIGRAGYPVRPVLESLLAQMYWNYYQQNRYQISQRSQLAVRDSDFTNWDLRTIAGETSRLYSVSLSDPDREINTPVSVLDGVLAGDSSTRYLRPALYDLLVNRALDFYLSDEAVLTRPRLPFSINDPRFFSDSHTFAGLRIKTTDTVSAAYKGILFLQQATQLRLRQENEEALADVDLRRLSFLYEKASLANKSELYLRALKQIASHFSAKQVSATAIQLQGKYYQDRDSLITAYSYYKKAIAAYPNSLGGKNAAILIKQIQTKELSATVEEVNIPGKPLLALLRYRNLSSAVCSIYRLSEKQMNVYEGNTRPYDPNIMSLQKFRVDFLTQLRVAQTAVLKLTNEQDYKSHSAEFKIAALSPGNYVLLVNDGSAKNDTLTELTNFKVSGLAYTVRGNPDNTIRLLAADRETGRPLSGVRVDLKASFWNSGTDHRTAGGLTGKDGIYEPAGIPSESTVTATLTLKDDTLADRSKNVNGAQDRSDDDDPENKTILYTDRQLYRPGQTIYFAGLQLQTIKGKSKIMPGKAEAVQFLDVNNKTVSTLSLAANDFGTFSGSFIIPQSMLDGDVTLKTEDGEIEVKVEEYKRPTFQVQFLPVTGSYKLNDTVLVKGSVEAFSGYGISAAKVAYHVTRSENRDYHAGYVRTFGVYHNPVTAEIKNDTITTDDRGNFRITFRAVPGEQDGAAITYTYSITADVTDASSETHSAETAVKLGDNDIEIVNNLPSQALTNDTISVPVSIINLNGEPQAGTVKVAVYSLKRAGHLFQERLWQKPDTYLLSQDQYRENFPFYAFKNEEVISSWPAVKEVFGKDIKLDEKKPGIINLAALNSDGPGWYRIVLSARNSKGDTTSVIRYLNLIGETERPVNFNNWVIPASNAVRPGKDAEFLVGAGEKLNVLMERYNGASLVSAKWITIGKNRETIRIPVTAADNDPAVQFLTFFQNRVYSSYQKISVIRPDKSLQLRFLTFRDKLQPGAHEQWKLQVTGKDGSREAAEMIAGLYDASLDDITPPQNWNGALSPDNAYTTNFFAWNSYDFLNPANTAPVINSNYYFRLLFNNYERLNMLGYDYYGDYNYGYQRYLENARVKMNSAQTDKNLEAGYIKNAAKVKTGYDVSGKVISSDDGLAIPGVSVKIRGLNIGTLTNSQGYFKVKVPANAVLTFSFIGYDTREIATESGKNLLVKLQINNSQLSEVVVTGALGIKRKYKTLAYAAQSVYPNNLLEGRVAGVAVNQGAPGAPGTVFIRGVTNFGNVPKPIALRSNFNETAFFYPQLHTDAKGQVSIEFTIPQALTRWKFRSFAHTKDLQTGYIENTVVTQKQLSISANMPRFIREGDTVIVSARLANLTAGLLKGRVQLQLFNALTMQPVNLFLNDSDAGQPFTAAGNTNKAVSFRLAIPAGIDALTYRLTADAGEYTDGEENTLPVLPNRMLVTESMPMMVRAGQTRDFNFDRLIHTSSATLKSKTLTLEYTANPAWYAVQALPYMMEFPYECSEQVFSRYFANSLSTAILNKTPAIKKVFDRWKSSSSGELLSNVEKNPELKETLVEETPWLQDAISESEQKKRIALLFDMNKMSDDLTLNLAKLQKKQLPDGGFPWFGGEQSDRFISQHILEGIGQLYHAGIGSGQSGIGQLADNIIRYLDDQVTIDAQRQKRQKTYDTRQLSDIEVQAWFTRSYFLNKPLNMQMKALFSDYLNKAQDQWRLRNVYEQGMIALTMQRYKKPAVTVQIERSLLETAQQSDELGMYWARNQAGYFWYESPVETQSLLIELFTEAGDNKKVVDEMKIWLLRNKQTNDWKTTKATAAACYALLLKGGDLLADNGTSAITLDGKPLEELKPSIKADAGTGYLKTSWVDEQINPALGKVEIRNSGKNISWGALHWQYLENLDKISASHTNIQLERSYFIQKQTDAGPVLTAVDAVHQPKTGDLLKVVVHLKADRDFEYIQLKDMRPAGTEPVDAISTYKYQDGLYYYQVSKDVATSFFISFLNKGSYVFEYQLRVAQPGNFSTGITSVQCMYAPEFNTHSPGERMMVRP